LFYAQCISSLKKDYRLNSFLNQKLFRWQRFKGLNLDFDTGGGILLDIRHDRTSNYLKSDRCHLVVSNYSTLMYEVISRGVTPVAILNTDSKSLGSDFNFGWPLRLPTEGPFWTHSSEREDVINILEQSLNNRSENLATLGSFNFIPLSPQNGYLLNILKLNL
jgi:surface carbohydrate biosynthesis protein